MTLSTVVLALIGLILRVPPPLAIAAHAPLAPILAIGALGVFNTALAYYVYFRLVNEEGPTFATLNNYIAPLIGVVGGAIVQLITGHTADWVGLKFALLVPAVCYLGILSFGVYARRPKEAA